MKQNVQYHMDHLTYHQHWYQFKSLSKPELSYGIMSFLTCLCLD